MISLQRNILNVRQPHLIKRSYIVIANQFKFRHLCQSNKHLNLNVDPVHKSFQRLFRVSSANFDSKPTDIVPNAPISSVDFIPEPPSELFDQKLEAALNHLGEPTFASLGLNSYSPSGFSQYLLENVHVFTELPWWASIMCTAAFVKLCLMPVLIKSRITLPKITNMMQTVQEFEHERKKAVSLRDPVVLVQLYRNSAHLAEELNNFKKLIMNSLYPFVQAFVMISFFNGLRGMVNTPVAALQVGGPSLFPDLTTIDPYFIAPSLTSLTIFLIIKTSMSVSASQAFANKSKRYYALLFGAPALSFFFLSNSSSAVCLYFIVNNVCTAGVNYFLSKEAVKAYFKIPAIQVKSKKGAASTGIEFNRNFFKSFKKVFKTRSDVSQMYHKVEGIGREDDKKWQSAGQASIKKTYKYNPKTNLRSAVEK